MSEDKFTDLMLRTLDDHIEAKRAEGLTDTEILERINKIDFTEIFSKMTETMATDTVDMLEKTMYVTFPQMIGKDNTNWQIRLFTHHRREQYID